MTETDDALVETVVAILAPNCREWSIARRTALSRSCEIAAIIAAREAAAREQGRREGIEAAAKVAEDDAERDWTDGVPRGQIIAAAIRQQENENG